MLRILCSSGHSTFDSGSRKKEYQQQSFWRVEDYVEYKFEPYDVVVDDVSDAYTSQACSRTDCPHAARSNRSDNVFECGHALDADLNAAKNVVYPYSVCPDRFSHT